MKKIAVLPGDGIGPEVTNQAIKVLNAIAEVYGHEFEYNEGLIGAAAIDATGNPYPDATDKLCKSPGIDLSVYQPQPGRDLSYLRSGRSHVSRPALRGC